MEPRGTRPLSLAQAISNALHAEESAARFYNDLASRTVDPNARLFLSHMGQVEQEHAAMVQTLRDNPARRLAALAPNDRAKLVEVVPDWAIGTHLDLEGALHVALDAERKAWSYYQTLAGYFEGQDAELLAGLARTEQHHAAVLQTWLEKFEMDRAAGIPSPESECFLGLL